MIMTTRLFSKTKAKVTLAVSIIIILLLASIGISGQRAVITCTFSQNFSGKSLKLTLINYETRNDKVVRQTVIGQDGKFTFSIKLKEPEIYDLAINNLSIAE